MAQEDTPSRLRSMFSRRGLLKAAGASAAGAAVANFHGGALNPKDTEPIVLAQEDEDEFEWDDEFDVVVVGSGAAAGSAAVTAHESGASVAILEKTESFGGTTAVSGGTYWIPNNSQMRAAGLDDPREDAIRYMARLSYPHMYHPEAENLGLSEHNFRLIEAFYDKASDAIDALDEMGAVRSIVDLESPDYHAHLPENAAPFGREMNPETEEGGSGSGGELIVQLRTAVEDRDIPILLEHRVTRLVQDEDGAVVGVEVQTPDDETLYFGASAGVIFGTGGFTHNSTLRREFLRGPIYGGCAVPSAEGDFVYIGASAGAELGNMQNAWWTQVVYEQVLDQSSVPQTLWQTPGDSVLQVNRFGHRVMNEKMQYNERSQIHFNWDPVRAEYTNLLLFMVYDQRTADEFAGWYPISQPDADDSYVIRGETLEDLEANLQSRLEELEMSSGGVALDEEFLSNLHGTLNQFNLFAETGEDRQFHRGEVPFEESFHNLYGPAPEHDYPNQMMHPLSEEGPYYCVIVCAGALDTKGGPKINENAQVLDAAGNPIPGLYGAGNCVASPAGQAYWAAGGTLGPALTFGYIAGLSVTDDIEPSDDDEPDEGYEEEPEDDDANDVDEPDEEEDEVEEDDDDDDDVAAEPQDHTVEIKDDLTFDPEHIDIRVGDSITFVNVGQMMHTATCDPDRAFDEVNAQMPDGAEAWHSGNLEAGEAWTYTFEVAGDYTYACIPHEVAGQVGSITVEE